MKVKITGLKSTLIHFNKVIINNDNHCKDIIKQAMNEAKNKAYDIFQKSDYAGIKNFNMTGVKWNGKECSFTAEGESVLFQEFGTGVTLGDLDYGTTYPRNKNSQIFVRGTYDKGKGSNPKGWYFSKNAVIESKYTYIVKTTKIGNTIYKTMGNEGAKAMLSAYNYIKDFIDRGGKR